MKAILLILLALGGCATQTPDRQAALKRFDACRTWAGYQVKYEGNFDEYHEKVIVLTEKCLNGGKQ